MDYSMYVSSYSSIVVQYVPRTSTVRSYLIPSCVKESNKRGDEREKVTPNVGIEPTTTRLRVVRSTD
jgi:hypothetical protein